MTGAAPAFALIGRKLAHSWSPQIHGSLGSVPYRLVELEPDEVEDFICGNDEWRGLNVTIPYKAEAYRLADARSPRADVLGVANTLVRRPDGSVFADNTDVLGFEWMLEEFCRKTFGSCAAHAIAGREVLVLGSGGASKSVRSVLERSSGHVSVISRSGPDNYDRLLENHPNAAFLVNTTPVGMFPNCPDSPLTFETMRALSELGGVLDVVYNPERTGICLFAERLGIPWQSGLGMLVAQAFYSSQLFQGKRLNESLIHEIMDDIQSRSRNIVLIGMPGAGKTTCGRQLARILNRPFVDLDDAFSIEFSMTPSDYIERHGEDAFRELESRVCASYCARSGLVISCGGGIVTRQNNYALLHQNSTIVFLDRPIGELSSHGRPLSRERGVDVLARERMELYQAWADHRVACTGSAAGDAEKIAGLLFSA
ncbi:MAG: shikimate kinase [Olsenella sp.]|nr:shikimate kinase [Olsenella sp.]